MAPITISTNTFSAPLADFFFIVGIESSRIFGPNTATEASAPTSPIPISPSEDDALFPAESASYLPSSPTSPSYQPISPTAFVFPKDCFDTTSKRPRYSYDAKKSIGGVFGIQDNTATPSNNNTASVRTLPCGDQNTDHGTSLSDVNFDQALKKFASERDSFLEEIQFSAGQLAQPDRPRPKAKTQRMSAGGHKRENSYGGSLRKRLSVINHLSRQSTSTRRGKDQ